MKSGKGALIKRWVGSWKGMTSLVRHGVARLWWIAKVADFAAVESVKVTRNLGETTTCVSFLLIRISNGASFCAAMVLCPGLLRHALISSLITT